MTPVSHPLSPEQQLVIMHTQEELEKSNLAEPTPTELEVRGHHIHLTLDLSIFISHFFLSLHCGKHMALYKNKNTPLFSLKRSDVLLQSLSLSLSFRGMCTTSITGFRRIRSALCLLTTSPTSLSAFLPVSTATRCCKTFWRK